MPTDHEPLRFRLTALDEWPRHQTAATFDTVANPSPHWSDGYYFALGDHAGDVLLLVGFRLYPNNDVLDGFAVVSTGGRQYNLRVSCRLRPSNDDLSCPPLAVDIVEGLRHLRTTCAPNEHHIAFELDWRGTAPAYIEDYLVNYRAGRLVSERSNFDQTCDVTGWIEIDGRRFGVDPSGWAGVRDHSWGIGSVGGSKHPDSAPLEPEAPLGLRQWAMFRMPDRALFWQFHRRFDGEVTRFESQVVPGFGRLEGEAGAADGEPGGSWAYTTVDAAVSFVDDPGGDAPLRRMRAGTVEFTRPDGGIDGYALEVLSGPAYCLGGGYWNGYADGRGRGVYRGEHLIEGEVWDVSHPTRIVDPTGRARPRNAWAETWARITNLDDPADVGYGHLECVVLGPWPGLSEEGG